MKRPQKKNNNNNNNPFAIQKEEIYVRRRCIKPRLSLGSVKSFSVAINRGREGVRRESTGSSCSQRRITSFREGRKRKEKAGRKSREGEPALSHADIRGYPTGESGVTHFHGLLLAGENWILLILLQLLLLPAPRYTVDNGFSLDGHALSSRVPPSSNLRETIPLGWKETFLEIRPYD